MWTKFFYLLGAISILMSCGLTAAEEERTESNVTVNAESDEAEHDQFTEMGEYAQPAWAERSRLSATTKAYVLSPYEMAAEFLWQGDFRRHGKSVHDLIQEIDLGLLHRFEVGLENKVGLIGSDAHETSVTLEARYALANWNAIPLNPALAVEYIFGVGDSVELTRRARHGDTLREEPDALAFTLLLGQNFAEHFGYGLNLGLQQNVTHNSGRAFELSQTLMYGALKGQFEAGAEMRYTHFTPQARPGEQDELEIGPSFGWKPSRQLRVAASPLFGCTHDAPVVAVMFLVSYEFGGAEAMVPSPAHGEK